MAIFLAEAGRECKRDDPALETMMPILDVHRGCSASSRNEDSADKDLKTALAYLPCRSALDHDEIPQDP